MSSTIPSIAVNVSSASFVALAVFCGEVWCSAARRSAERQHIIYLKKKNTLLGACAVLCGAVHSSVSFFHVQNATKNKRC